MKTNVPETPTCPNCHKALPPRAPRGLCPRCLLRAGMGDVSSGTNLGSPQNQAEGGVLKTLAEVVGDLSQVLLRDAEPRDAHDFVVRPGSPELPEGVDRPSRLQLFGEIARGGMGAVLKGRDPDLGRELAVKVLLDAHRYKPELVRRFVEEAQIAGQLQHPGVVPVYELGTFADDRPYFSMKLVRGRTLTELLHNRSGPGDGAPRFLSVFEAVCQTVAYAHARGVIHRDLKPSNVMVGSFGEVQVMDWGLAKILSRGGAAADASAGKISDHEEAAIATARQPGDGDLSAPGSVMGTPAYMAPEQARGELDRLDERADVFALGAILCEILTGSPPFLGRNSREILRRSAQADLFDAMVRLGASAADEDLIQLARDCLAALVEHRPRDAGVVAGKISAHLAGVQDRLRRSEVERAAEAARAETAEARTAAERRARRLTTALSATFLAVALAVVGGFLWLAQLRQAQALRTEGLINEAASACDQAERGGSDADTAAAWERARVALAQAGEVSGDQPPASTAGRLRALQERVALAGKLRALLNALEAVRAGRALDKSPEWLDREYAEAFRAFGVDPDAVPPARVAETLGARPASVEIAAGLDAWTRQRRVTLKGRDDLAWRRLVDASRAVDPDRWRNELRAILFETAGDRLKALRALAADPETLAKQPAASLFNLADGLTHAGDRDRAAQVLRAAWGRFPGDYWINSGLGRASWSNRDYRHERPDEAVRFLTAAAALRPDSPQAHDNLGVALRSKWDLDGAIAEHRAAVRLRPDDANARNNLGVVLLETGNMDGATEEFREVLRIDPDDPEAHNNLGDALRTQGDLKAAVAEYREAVRLAPAVAPLHDNLGIALRESGDLNGAATEHRAALQIKPDDAGVHNNLALVLTDLGEHDQAIDAAREAVRLAPGLSLARNTLGRALLSVGRPADAAAAFREAIRLKPDNAMAHNNLGLALVPTGDLAGAIVEHRAALKIRPDLVSAWNNLASALLTQNQLAEAIDAYRQVIRLQPDHALAHNNLAWILVTSSDPALRDFAAAVDHARKAATLDPKNGSWWSTLAVAEYRAGHWPESKAAVERSMTLRNGGDAYDWFLLALLHDRKGEVELARTWFDKAVSWTRKNSPRDEPLRALWTEAASRRDQPGPP